MRAHLDSCEPCKDIDFEENEIISKDRKRVDCRNYVATFLQHNRQRVRWALAVYCPSSQKLRRCSRSEKNDKSQYYI